MYKTSCKHILLRLIPKVTFFIRLKFKINFLKSQFIVLPGDKKTNFLFLDLIPKIN